LFVKNRIQSCVEQTKKCATMSSCRSCAPDALPAALLRPVQVGLRPLGVAGLGYRHDDIFDGDEVFVRDVPVVGHDLRAPVVAVLLDDLGQLVADDLPLPLGPGRGCRAGPRSRARSRPARR
jgi:hypothetical protein